MNNFHNLLFQYTSNLFWKKENLVSKLITIKKKEEEKNIWKEEEKKYYLPIKR